MDGAAGGVPFGGDVTLATDVTAGADDPALTVPAQADVTLHMNGRTLSRGLTSPVMQGSVLIAEDRLTLSGEGTIPAAAPAAAAGACMLRRAAA